MGIIEILKYRVSEIVIGFFLGMLSFYFLLYEEPRLLDMYDIDVIGNDVIIDRQINLPIKSNWSVEVFHDEDGQICQGASKKSILYNVTERDTARFPISEYVGDPECQESLTNGYTYTIIVHWIPTDKDYRPVIYYDEFTYRNPDKIDLTD